MEVSHTVSLDLCCMSMSKIPFQNYYSDSIPAELPIGRCNARLMCYHEISHNSVIVYL